MKNKHQTHLPVLHSKKVQNKRAVQGLPSDPYKWTEI